MAETTDTNWDLEADVIVIGSGAAGMPAAIKAVDEGASVIVVEANYDVGGHAILSGGHMALGGGTSAQKKYDIPDSPDTVFSDLTDWSVVQPNGTPDFRYNDRALMRAFADHCAIAFEFLARKRRRVRRQGAGQSRRVDAWQFRAAGESCDLDQRRRAGKSQRGQRHRGDAAAGSERAQEGREIFAQLQNDQHRARTVARWPRWPCHRHHRPVQPAHHARFDDAAEKFSLGRQYRQHQADDAAARAQSGHRRHRRQHQPSRVSPHVRSALDARKFKWAASRTAIKTPAAS